uniref:Uncharacterized protein n=1 Tax=Meloidogyne hapla TaxID=6305 RepID=A0A1I8BQ14_MELHA
MDGLLLILLSWFVVSLICYFFILRYNRRRQSTTTINNNINRGQHNDGSILMHDVANWLVWGTGEKSTKINEQFAILLTKSLNESSRRLQEQGQPEMHFDAIQLQQGSTNSTLKDFHVRPNRSPGNHLSISGKVFIENTTNEIQPKINIWVTLYEQQIDTNLNKGETIIKKTSKIENPRNYGIIIEEMNGEAEVRLAQIAGELFIIACFSGRPDVKLKILEPTAEKAMESFVVEFARKCILGAVLNFSLGELLYPDEETTARPQKFPLAEGELSEHLRETHFLHIHLMELRELQDGLINSSNERPFVCIELDEPSSERFLSPKGHLDAHSGNYWFWHDGEANFELAIAPTGGELLFELFTETPSFSNEKEIDLPPTAIYGTVRQRSFLFLLKLPKN